MKHIFLIITLFITVVSSFAQTAFKGKVQSGNTPLAGATLIAINGKGSAVTNNDGTFEIVLQNTRIVKVQFLGYYTVEKELVSDSNTVIQLVEELSSLEEVVISASRETQKRKEVPNAIAVISSQKIEETKAFGIDQLVNDTPGVYMSTSRSSSNEQHFTSIRSPISTKPLFLFLEDGLPIRPTSIFNHNALLEMNQVAYDRIEVLRGPAASIYGSDAIGGSFNFITKNPTNQFKGAFDLQSNTLGLSSANLDFGTNISDKVGFYLASQYNQRVNGPFEHSDYNKKAITFKTVIKPAKNSRLTLMASGIDFFTDMAGSIGERNYRSRNFESNQTFTNRDAESFRLRSTWEQQWNSANKTSFSFVYRKNVMKQNPSFRIRQNREMGQLTGTGSGEVNNNTFKSGLGNIQHQIKFNNYTKLIIGGSLDITEQDYISERTMVTVNPITRKNTGFTIDNGNFILNYIADISNYAGYTQFEVAPIEKLKFTLGGRYDYFEYDFDNRIESERALTDRKDKWNNFSPKVGANFNLTKDFGLYVNYSTGFTPPQSSTLYRSRDRNEGIKPSRYQNAEIGSYIQLTKKLKADIAIYVLKGKNTLITIRDPQSDNGDAFLNTNAGETTSYGVEYGISYKPLRELEFTHNGSYAKHKYDDFEFRGQDFSNTERETAPSLIGTTKVIVNSGVGLRFTAEHEVIGRYNTSLEGQAQDENDNPSTTTYSGHNVFNFQIAYKYKKVELWMHILNVFDKLYANRVSYNRFRNENSYTVGNPRALHFGARYNF